MSGKPRSTIVLGGGLSGLVAAHEIARRGGEVLVLESSSEPGGAVRTVRQDGFLLELGPNTVRPTLPLWNLTRELGLESEALLADPKLPRFILLGGRLRKIPFQAMSIPGMLRAASEPFVRRRRCNGEETLESFGRRRFGREVADNLLGSFVSGVYAGDASRLSASASFPKLTELEEKFGSVVLGFLRSPRHKTMERPPRGLLSFRDGLTALPKALARKLGAGFRPSASTERIELRTNGFRVETSAGAFEAERLVVALPAWDAARLLQPIAPAAAAALGGIGSPPLAVAHLAFRSEDVGRPVRGFGCLVAPSEPSRFLGIIFTSELFGNRAPEGFRLWTAFLGGRRRPENASLSEAEVRDAVLAEGRRMFDLKAAPRVVRLTRYERAIPQYEIGHGQRLEALASLERERVGLYFIGNYRGGISVGDVVESASREGRRD